MKNLISPLFMVCALVFLSQGAAESPQSAGPTAYAEVVFVQGGDLLLLRADGQTVNADPIGTRLFTGDQVQTGAKTSVELVTMPRRSRLRLSENTVVKMGSLENDGSTSLNLLYGRLRSKVEKLAGKPAPYKVSSQSFVAGVRGTDFGCDVLVSRPGEASSTRVYCFEGSVDVGPSVPSAQEAGKSPENPDASKASFAPVVVSAGAMAVIASPSQGGAVDVVEKPIDPETSSFWKANDFTAVQPSQAAAPTAGTEPIAAGAGPLPAPAIDLTPIRKGIVAKNNAVIGACIFFSIGAAFEGAYFCMRGSDPNAADSLLRGGAIFIGTGLPVLFFAVSINPLRGVKR
jgi:hypothetical protein